MSGAIRHSPIRLHDVDTPNPTFSYRARNEGVISLHTCVTEITQNTLTVKCSRLQHALHRCAPRGNLIQYVRQSPVTTTLYEPQPHGTGTCTGPVDLNFRHNMAVRVSCPGSAILSHYRGSALWICCRWKDGRHLLVTTVTELPDSPVLQRKTHRKSNVACKLTLRSRVLPEKLTVPHLAKKSPA
jgi:hypothetical protein